MNLPLVTEYFNPKMILDVGANTGQWYSDAKRHFSDATIISVEGNIHCLKALKKHNTLNQLLEIAVRDCMVQVNPLLVSLLDSAVAGVFLSCRVSILGHL